MILNINTSTAFTVYGKTRAGTRVPVPAGVTPSVSVPHAASVTFDPVTFKGAFVAPATPTTDTFTVSDGTLTPYAAALTYILDPNEVVAFDVSFP